MSSNGATIKVSSSSMKNASELSNMHFLPCKIGYDGKAKVDEYFQCAIKENEEGGQKGLIFIVYRM